MKAIVIRGAIQPLEPLPADWSEGQTLRVERDDEREGSCAEVDRDFALLAALCEQSDASDEETLEHAIDEARRLAKQQVRRAMGLG